jgi:hypothetical protein
MGPVCVFFNGDVYVGFFIWYVFCMFHVFQCFFCNYFLRFLILVGLAVGRLHVCLLISR